VGDPVTAYDPRTGKSSTQTVQHVWLNHDHDLLDVTLYEDDGQDGHATEASSSNKTQEVDAKAHGSQAPPAPPSDETIQTTANHPWLTTDRGWVRAGALRVGEHVVEFNGHTATIAALAVRPGAATYYNLTVSQLHTYAVGDTQAVVHNTNGPCDPADLMDRVVAEKARLGISSGRNGVMYEYLDAEGKYQYKYAFSERGVGHAERLGAKALQEAGVAPESVTQIYSQLEPCEMPGGYCATFLKETFPNAKVSWSYPYPPGEEGAAIRRASIEALRAVGGG
jgi:nucleic acid/nucleotide deaminase of polymorphic system toxin/pretoxin HINT domain-containing protein